MPKNSPTTSPSSSPANCKYAPRGRRALTRLCYSFAWFFRRLRQNRWSRTELIADQRKARTIPYRHNRYTHHEVVARLAGPILYTRDTVETRPNTASHRIPPLAILSFAGILAVLAYATRLALVVAPTEATMGNIQRIFYYHVPANILAEIFPYLNFIASGVYLYYRTKNPARALAADALALASAELTVVFCSIGLASGMLWARPVWGIWWTWDARLTSFFLLWLLYVSYLVLRRFSSTGQTQTIAAILSIFAAVDVPIVFMSIRWWRTQHPAPVFGGDGSLDPAFYPAFIWCSLGWTMWAAFVCVVRYKLERRRQLNEQAAAFATLDA